jgi:peptidoglycan/LPS O-acetylase OafA/YrhL
MPECVTFGGLSRGRSNNFDVIRFTLALLVILTHSYGSLLGTSAAEPLLAATRGQLGFGDLAVDFFFVISGFLITASWINGDGLLSFLSKRVRRIYPGIAVAILLCLVVVAPLGAERPAEYLHQLSSVTFLRSILQLQIPQQSGIFAGQANPGILDLSLWTIRYEFLCYLMVAGFGLLGLLGRRPVVAAAFVLALGLYVWQTYAGGLPMLDWRVLPVLGRMQPWPRFLAFYAAGMVFYLYRDSIPYRSSLAWISAGMLALSLRTGLAFTLPLFGAYLLLYAAFHRTVRLYSFARYGDFSYGLYIYAFPVQQLLIHYFQPALTPLRLFLTASVITLLLAAASWHVIEAPCLRLGRLRRNPLQPGVLSPVV